MSEPRSAVFLVDDEPLVLRAVSRLLRSAGLRVETFASPADFLARGDLAGQGCLVLDIAMPRLTGLDLQRELAARGSHLPIIFLTGRADVPMTVQALKGGAVDFLTKPVDDAVLLAAIGRALESGRVAREQRADLDAIRARLATLTPREREVLDQIAAGRLNKQVAADLGTVEKTIKVHRGRVMEKMQVASIAELARLIERLAGAGG
ncbi:MAG: response regulator [Chthoniobacteraceae bacterium]